MEKKIYKIQDWQLDEIELNEKELEIYKKKYMSYNKGDMLIFNLDYNLIKPYVVRLLQMKGFYDDYNKITIMIVWVLCVVIWSLFYFFNNNINNKIKWMQKTYISKLNEINKWIKFTENKMNNVSETINEINDKSIILNKKILHYITIKKWK